MKVPTITLVTAPGCHLCKDAEEALAESAREFSLEIIRLEATSGEGLGLVAQHRPALFPLVLVDGEPFSAGRLPRKKLRRRLEREAVAP